MRIKCNQCQQEFGEHHAAGGIFTFFPAGVITGLVCGFLGHILPIWLLLLLVIPLWWLFAWGLWELPRWLTSLRHWRRRCPQCGARNWGRPRYSGFGL